MVLERDDKPQVSTGSVADSGDNVATRSGPSGLPPTGHGLVMSRSVEYVGEKALKPLQTKTDNTAQQLKYFFQELEDLFDRNLIGDDKTKFLLLRTHVGRDALIAIDGVPDVEKNSYDKLKKALEGRFGKSVNEVYALDKFRYFEMKSEWTTRRYVAELCEILQGTTMSVEVQDKWILSSLRQCHKSQAAREMLRRRVPESVDDAIAMCESLDENTTQKSVDEKHLGQKGTSDNPITIEAVTAGATGRRPPALNGRNPYPCRICGTQGCVKPECRNTCYVCGKQGHISRDCRVRARGGFSHPPQQQMSSYRGGYT